MSKIIKIIIGIIVLLISLIVLTFSYYVVQLSPTSNDNKMLDIEIPKGATGTKVAAILKKNDLIKDEMIFKVYLKIHNVTKINYGVYELNKAMDVKQIVDIISSNSKNKDIKILFKEGLNMRGIAAAIANNTNNTEDDVFNLLKDANYIDNLISKYWFLSNEIKNKDIYYPLEGYLAPNTYQFASKDVTVEEIFKELLDQEDKVLTKYKDNIENRGFTIHEILTLASIVEGEGVNDEDRPKIASVFYNRLDEHMAFQSCATACYAAKFDGPCVPKNVDTHYNSPYNTYQSNMIGLPVGPISNPGEASIKAAIGPVQTDYLYFLSDKNKKTYFSKTYDQHNATKRELIQAGLWYD